MLRNREAGRGYVLCIGICVIMCLPSPNLPQGGGIKKQNKVWTEAHTLFIISYSKDYFAGAE